MWYFACFLGVGLACTFGILNAMWFELHADDGRDRAAVVNDYC
jgi:cyd operon protein YbgT